MPSSINTSAIYNVFKVIRDPALCLPHGIVSSFDQLPLPISRAFLPRYTNSKCDIKAVVLDKDNCFAIPKTDEVYAPYQVSMILYFHLLVSLTYLIWNDNLEVKRSVPCGFGVRMQSIIPTDT